MDDVAIVSAVRTPIGILNGALSNLPAHELGAIVIEEALTRAKISSEEISEVIMGQVLTAAQGQNPARQAAVRAKIPVETPAVTVKQGCGSGLRSLAPCFQALRTGAIALVFPRGPESMSQAPPSVPTRKANQFRNSKIPCTL